MSLEEQRLSKKLRKIAQENFRAQRRRFVWFLAFCFALGLGSAGIVTAVGRSWGRSPDASPGPRPVVQNGAPSAKIASPELEETLKKARQLLSMELYNQALLEFTKATQMAPSDARPHEGLAECYRVVDRAGQAEEACRKAVLLDPGSISSKKKLAQILYEVGKHEESIVLFKEAEKTNPDDDAVIFYLARNLLRLGKPKEAVPLFEKYNTILKGQVWGYAYLGRAQAEAGNPAAAEKAYLEAIRLNPREAQPHLWLGQLLVAAGRKTEGEAELALFQKYRDLEEEVRSCQRDVRRNPNDVKALVKLARARYLLGRRQQALIPLRKALEITPNDQLLRKLYEDVLKSVEQGTESQQPVQPSR